MGSLSELYEQIILKHYREPYHHEECPNPSAVAKGLNPRCGDEIRLFLNEESNQIKAIYYRAQACAIATASASILARDLEGKSIGEALDRIHQIERHFRQVEEADFGQDTDLAAIASIVKFPARTKCALLPWQAIKTAIENLSQR